MPNFAVPTQLGDYTLEQYVDRGGFGEVYRATRQSERARREYAVKILDPERAGETTRNQEMYIGKKGRGHRNVVHYFGIEVVTSGPHMGVLFLVSEFCNPGSLKKQIEGRHECYSEEEVVALMVQVCQGVAHLHSLGVIHRDLKPANILLHNSVPKIGDFGISRLMKRSRGETVPQGSHHYMSPEAFDSKYRPAPTTDVWSLGVILYELLAGRLPFMGDGQEVRAAILRDEPARLPLSISPQLRSLIYEALAKRPAKRLQSAAEMQSRLQAVARTRTHRNSSDDEYQERAPRPLVAIRTAAVALAAITAVGSQFVPVKDRPQALLGELIRHRPVPDQPPAVAAGVVPLHRVLRPKVASPGPQAHSQYQPAPSVRQTILVRETSQEEEDARTAARGALRAARMMPDGDEKAESLGTAAAHMAATGDVEGALGAAHEISLKHDIFKEKALGLIVAAQVKVNDFPGARRTALGMSPGYYKDLALARIASAEHEVVVSQ